MVVALALGEPMDIADLVGQRHYSVSISIQRLVDRGVIALPPMVECPTPSGQLAKVYVFKGDQGKRDSITAPRMSSLEIAELNGKRHDHIMRDITKMLEDLDEG